MNLFEDLVEELKDANLLEETVIETSESEKQAEAELIRGTQMNLNLAHEKNEILEANPPFASSEAVINEKLSEMTDSGLSELTTEFSLIDSVNSAEESENAEDLSPQFKQPINESEFYRRRATEEVSSLKIVEHVISGIEREHMKIFPKTYDDVPVSKALHDFLKITQEVQAPEHAQAEFKLMQETESWYSSLSYRDKHISVGDLRRYCEISRPPLSSQALVSLARFYRNSPFSEAVRSKFDMVVTRLFSKESEEHQRIIVFDKQELIEQLTGLYADWSSIPLYAGNDEPEVLIATLKFGDFVSEANAASSFEELIKNDFFNRLRIFKESTGENFFAPLLTTTAIESNIEIGNRYVELVAKEREKGTVAELEEKYKYLVDQVVSDTTSKTLQLVELLKRKDAEHVKLTEEKETLNVSEYEKTRFQEKTKKPGLFGINKWVLALVVFAILFFAGLYTWVEYLNPEIPQSPSVKTYNPFNEFFKTGKINQGTLLLITSPVWDNLPKETKEDVLKKVLSKGAEEGYSKIHLMNKEGKTVGYASEKGIDLTQQQ